MGRDPLLQKVSYFLCPKHNCRMVPSLTMYIYFVGITNVVDDEDDLMILEPVEADEVVMVPTPTKGKRTMPELNLLPAKKRRVGDFSDDGNGNNTDEPDSAFEAEIVELD